MQTPWSSAPGAAGGVMLLRQDSEGERQIVVVPSCADLQPRVVFEFARVPDLHGLARGPGSAPYCRPDRSPSRRQVSLREGATQGGQFLFACFPLAGCEGSDVALLVQLKAGQNLGPQDDLSGVAFDGRRDL